MILDRQKLLLALLAANGGALDKVDFQKLLFLYTRTCESEPSFEFVPFKRGCYSFTSVADKVKLATKGFVADGEAWKLTERGKEMASRVPASVVRMVTVFSERRRHLRGEPLVAHTYREYPYWATRSQIAATVLMGDDRALAAIERVRPTPRTATLCSIGYEGRSLEGYLNALLGAGVTVLCDVRKNPLSRKYGFSRKTLSHVCGELGIRYEHLPQLGIESEDRQGLHDLASYQALFRQYAQMVLIRETAAVVRIADWVKGGECVALTCYERLPEYCHRTHVVRAVETSIESSVVDL